MLKRKELGKDKNRAFRFLFSRIHSVRYEGTIRSTKFYQMPIMRGDDRHDIGNWLFLALIKGQVDRG